jgi:hypothetical protein
MKNSMRRRSFSFSSFHFLRVCHLIFSVPFGFLSCSITYVGADEVGQVEQGALNARRHLAGAPHVSPSPPTPFADALLVGQRTGCAPLLYQYHAARVRRQVPISPTSDPIVRACFNLCARERESFTWQVLCSLSHFSCHFSYIFKPFGIVLSKK